MNSGSWIWKKLGCTVTSFLEVSTLALSGAGTATNFNKLILDSPLQGKYVGAPLLLFTFIVVAVVILRALGNYWPQDLAIEASYLHSKNMLTGLW